jgi:hypothetical protein
MRNEQLQTKKRKERDRERNGNKRNRNIERVGNGRHTRGFISSKSCIERN